VPDIDLDRELRALGRQLDVPPGPDPAGMVALVRRRLVARRATPSRQWLRYAAAMAVIAIAVLVAGSPQVRAAIVELLRFGGVVVEQGNPTPNPTPDPPQSGKPPETADGVAAAQSRVAFPVRVPAELGPPDEVSVIDGRVVSFSYRAAGIRLDQFDGTLDLTFAKTVPNPADVEWTQVDGATALWLRTPHELVYIDRAGQRHTESARLAANTLIWQRGQVTIRLEGAVTLERAVVIAQSIR